MKKAAHKTSVRKVSHSTKKHPHLTKLLLILAAILFLAFALPNTRLPMAGLLATVTDHLGLFQGSATVNWPKVDGAKSYNIYYGKFQDKLNQEPAFVFSVRDIPADQTSYTIRHLKRGWTYQYKISAVDASGKEFLWTSFENTPSAAY